VLLTAAKPHVLKFVSVALTLAGLRVVLAKSGLEAIREARSSRPDLVILDPDLPDMDGSTAADIIHQLPSTAGIPTFLLRQTSQEDESGLLLEVRRALSRRLDHFNSDEDPVTVATA
jgi:CheY-like chemotaxis protein